MPDNQQFIGVLNREGPQRSPWRGNYDRMVPVRRQGIRANEPRQPFTAPPTEAHVMAEFLGCSARFTTAQDVTFGPLLELDRDAWATVDPSLREGVAPHSPGASSRSSGLSCFFWVMRTSSV